MAEPDLLLSRGQYLARLAAGTADVAAAQALRTLCFRTPGTDCDAFDSRCAHVLVEHAASGTLVCCFRLLVLPNGGGLEHSYAAQFYELPGLRGFAGPMAELGRFCIHPDWHDPDILRLAWGAVTGLVDGQGVQMLFGCSSFAGTSAAPYLDTFALLRQRHLAPAQWRVGEKAPEVVRYAAELQQAPDMRRALQAMPPLLRTYLAMGGWVSDHAVVDRQMNTLHVFTGLETGAIPEARKRLLRAVAG
ncbi:MULTISPECIES: GNAT family N-acetyltransferase [Leisingera]|jgi:putative hemolysin|uniref:GNAT family N-acetyltransferase n=1 Tax=Leisingera TaxID=191028 RepID=UPI00114E074C|nr:MULTISPECIES: GNAT family N-acetyltransferase [Leisingera]QDI75533.1 GNAT family N-acetyltransferase [Leisingera aquaemixtae]